MFVEVCYIFKMLLLGKHFDLPRLAPTWGWWFPFHWIQLTISLCIPVWWVELRIWMALQKSCIGCLPSHSFSGWGSGGSWSRALLFLPRCLSCKSRLSILLHLTSMKKYKNWHQPVSFLSCQSDAKHGIKLFKIARKKGTSDGAASISWASHLPRNFLSLSQLQVNKIARSWAWPYQNRSSYQKKIKSDYVMHSAKRMKHRKDIKWIKGIKKY